MSLYLVRVELLHLKVDHPSYAELHQKMRDANYLRFFETPEGKTEDLPNGQYIKIDNTRQPEAIAAEIEAVVRAVHKGESLFTMGAVSLQRDFVLRRIPPQQG